MELTSDAPAFIPMMRELVYQADKIKETAHRIQGLEEGTLTIGISYAGYFKLISGQLKHFTDLYPKVKKRPCRQQVQSFYTPWSTMISISPL